MRRRWTSLQVVAECRDLPTVGRVLDELMPRTIILDLEPMVLSWEEPDDQLLPRISHIGIELGWQMRPIQVVLATNSRRRLPPTSVKVAKAEVCFLSKAAKPRHKGRYARFPRPIVVVGDQLVTDGILAWRLGAKFILWRGATNMPLWPTIQHRIGLFAMRLLGPDNQKNSGERLGHDC